MVLRMLHLAIFAIIQFFITGCFASYGGQNQKVSMFNPWGNSFKPHDPIGLVNGYLTKNGIFDIPSNEFLQVFSGFTYETNTSA